MLRMCMVCMVSLLMAANTMALDKEIKLDSQDMTFVGNNYKQVKKQLKDIKNIDIIQEQGIVRDLFIKTEAISVDGIKVGDTIQSVKKIYPAEWIHESEEGIIVLKGAASHYNVVTKYIAYLKQGDRISEIQLGNTAYFTEIELPTSNNEAYKLLEGTWVSDSGRVIHFNNQVFEDNLMEVLYDHQSYRVIAPNELTIYSYIGQTVCKSNIKFWVNKNYLYLFKVNKLGIPIKETIEGFKRITK